MPAPIAATGAPGFVGSHLIRRLRDEGLPVRALVRSTRHAPELRALGCEAAVGDVRARASLAAAVAGCSAVVHLVAIIRERRGQTFDAINRQGGAHARRAGGAAGG